METPSDNLLRGITGATIGYKACDRASIFCLVDQDCSYVPDMSTFSKS
ncbi:MAG: hypothetical protein SGJ27_03240 [Candidatus Melainabacteria bacterium]|nr:hypothetical protein [Candidatus Melainabacteria bacterium]